MKTLYFDCETTGLDPVINDIIQIAGIIEVNGEMKERFNWTMQPFSFENIDQKALEINRMTVAELKISEKPQVIYSEIEKMFDKYIDKYNRDEKFIVCGYNVRFDIDFLNQFFKKNHDDYVFSYLGQVKDPFPVIMYLKSMGKIHPKSCKLTDVCEYFGIKMENAHDALSDIDATKLLINKVDKILEDTKI